MPGTLIAGEGVDGAGKSHLIDSLRERLKSAGHGVTVYSQKRAGPLISEMRHIRLDTGEPLSVRAELMLAAATLAQGFEAIIEPALARGEIVLADRYIDSLSAYDASGNGLSLPLVDWIGMWAIKNRFPDLTLLLDLPPEVGLARHTEHDRVSARALSYHHRVRQGFLEAAMAAGHRFVVIDATQPAETVLDRAWSAVLRCIA